MARLLVLIIAGLSLVGCANQGVRILSEQKCRNPNQCTINVINPSCGTSGCTASVDFDRTIFERGQNNFKVTWKLPAGFAFCDTAGDGVWLKRPDPHAQFEKPSAEAASGSGPCRFKEFQLRAKNTRSLPQDPYEYKIIFHDEAGTTLYVVDPFMMN
jgi:hypothetical protein